MFCLNTLHISGKKATNLFRCISANIFVLFIFLLVSANACTEYQDPEFKRLDDFKISKFGLQGITLDGTAVMFNPNKVGLTIANIDVSVYTKEKHLADFSQNVKTKVKRKSEFRVPFNIEIKPAILAKASSEILTAIKEKKITLTFKGKIHLRKGLGFSIPFTYTDTYGLY